MFTCFIKLNYTTMAKSFLKTIFSNFSVSKVLSQKLESNLYLFVLFLFWQMMILSQKSKGASDLSFNKPVTV